MLYEDPNTGDLAIQSGRLREATGNDATVVRMAARLRTAKGEWFLDTEFGTDYHNIIWPKSVAPAIRAAHIQQQALLSAGQGARIISYEQSLDGATRTFTATVGVRLGNGVETTVGV